MADLSAQEIRDYCRAWSERAAAHHRLERVRGGVPRLHQASPLANLCDDLETADHEHLTAVVAGLTVCLVRQGGEFAGYGRDYRLMWAWCAELLIGSGRGAQNLNESTLRRLFVLTCHAALARPVAPELPGVERHARELVIGQASVVGYLAFPLLEQVMRASCGRHFGAGGYVTHPFQTPGQLSSRHLYAVGGTCSSIGDLLWLYRQHYASPAIRENLDAIDEHLADVVPGGVLGFRVLQSWRHETLSGTSELPIIGAAVLSLVMLIALAECETGFGDAVARALSAAAGGSGASQFYPLEG